MTVTHGTRSSYNRGCRCDACREASRLARARQRAVATERISRTEPSLRTPSPWVFVALLAGAGVGRFGMRRGFGLKRNLREQRCGLG